MRRYQIFTVSCLAVVAFLTTVGCRSDFNQQLLERELRLQEDQIYHLQDELYDKCSRLDLVAAENLSLKKQLGIADFPESSRRPTPAQSSASGMKSVDPPALAPPLIEDLPPPPRSNGTTEQGLSFGVPETSEDSISTETPVLEGVPPLPMKGGSSPNDINGTSGNVTETDESMVKQLSYDQSVVAGSTVSHLVLNREKTECLDSDHDGISEALTVVFEPRDKDERLVSTVGDVSIAVYAPSASTTAFDSAGEGNRIALWEIPANEAARHFRRTSEHRGLHFVRPWEHALPNADHVRVFVRMTTFEGEVFETQGTVETR